MFCEFRIGEDLRQYPVFHLFFPSQNKHTRCRLVVPLFGSLKPILQFLLINVGDICFDLQEPAVLSCSSKIFKEGLTAFHEIKVMFLSVQSQLQTDAICIV